MSFCRQAFEVDGPLQEWLPLTDSARCARPRGVPKGPKGVPKGVPSSDERNARRTETLSHAQLLCCHQDITSSSSSSSGLMGSYRLESGGVAGEWTVSVVGRQATGTKPGGA